MAKDSDKLRRRADVEQASSALSGLLAEEDEFDRRSLWRLGTWAAVSIGAVIVALITNQSSIGLRHEQTASADLLKQAQQLQSTAKESQNETRRLASAIDTLNSDRDRLFSRVAVLEQGLDSVTGAIARQNTAPASSQATASLTAASQASAKTSPSTFTAGAPASPSPSNVASNASTVASSPADSSPAVTKPSPVPVASTAPVVGPVAATTPAIVEKAATASASTEKATIATTVPGPAEKQDKQASKPPASADKSLATTEPSPTVVASLSPQQPATAQQAAASLTVPKPVGPPEPAAGKPVESTAPPKAAVTAPSHEIAALAPKTVQAAEPKPIPPEPELTVQHTEFGVDVGGANSIPGLRALWRGLLKSKANAALTKLRPMIVIKENTNGLGMQLRLVAGPISDAAAAAKICASLTVSERNCSTAVFEGQRLALGADEPDKTEGAKADTSKPDTSKPVETGKADADSKSSPAQSRSGHRHYYAAKRPKVVEQPPPPPPPPEQPSTLSLIFGKRS